MTYLSEKEFYYEVRKGSVPGTTFIHKFGKISAADMSTSVLTPVCAGGYYKTPTAATQLDFYSDDANDTDTTGTGARKIFIQGLDSNFAEISETVSMAGLSAATTSNSYIRLYRAYITESGSYADQATPSQLGKITAYTTGSTAAADTWMVIEDAAGVAGFGAGQSQIACYTIPAGYTGILVSLHAWVDTGKSVDILFFQRPNANDVSTPYSGGMRVVEEFLGVNESLQMIPRVPIATFNEYTDIGFMAIANTSTSPVSADFQLVLIENT